MVIALFCGPLYVQQQLRWKFRCESALIVSLVIQIFVNLLIGAFSFDALFIMNVDGYFTIVHPVFHRTKITKGRLFKCLIVLWLLAGAIVVSFLFSRGDMHYRQIFISCNAALYGYACFYLRQDLLYKQEIFYKLSKDVQKKCCISSRQRCFAFGKKTTSSQLKAKSCFIVVVCYCICFLPLTL